jgi:hypothetical protein
MRRPAVLILLTCLTAGAAVPAGRAAAPARVAPSAPTPPPATRPAPDPAGFALRAQALGPDDVDGRLALARWARDRQMWPEVEELAQAILYRDPNNRAAYTLLQLVDDARPLPDEPQTEELLKAECDRRFGHAFKTRATRHFLLCYDTADAFAVARGAAMERVYDAFFFYFNMDKLRPTFLDRRLVVFLFKDRADYLSYIQQTEKVDVSWSAGFYSQRTNRSAFFDDSSGPTAASYVKEAGDLRTKVDDLNRQIREANARNERGKANQLVVDRDRAGEALAQVTTRLGTTVQMRNTSKTLHEAAHQVAFNIGIQTRLVDYPMWFAEGLACSFETEDAVGRRGPAVLNFGRIAGIKDALRAGTLIPVEKLVTDARPEKLDEGSLTLFYAEGWGLFHYLYKFHRAGMEKYLMTYAAHATLRPVDAEERRKLFTDAFGDDWAELDKKFVAYLKALPAQPR